MMCMICLINVERSIKLIVLNIVLNLNIRDVSSVLYRCCIFAGCR
jgi:hypothetical protein